MQLEIYDDNEKQEIIIKNIKGKTKVISYLKILEYFEEED